MEYSIKTIAKCGENYQELEIIYPTNELKSYHYMNLKEKFGSRWLVTEDTSGPRILDLKRAKYLAFSFAKDLGGNRKVHVCSIGKPEFFRFTCEAVVFGDTLIINCQQISPLGNMLVSGMSVSSLTKTVISVGWNVKTSTKSDYPLCFVKDIIMKNTFDYGETLAGRAPEFNFLELL